jgi:hypothetical protein
VTSATGALLAARAADITEVDVVAFGRALTELSVDEIRAISRDLSDASSSIADEIALTRSVLLIEQTLRRTHRLQNAAAAALAAATAVQEAAQRARVTLPDSDVTRVARAAAQLARALVAAENLGTADAVRCLGRGWHRLPCCDVFAA